MANYISSQIVNKIGKYLKKGLDGAFKFKVSSNMCDVYVTVLYQLPWQQQIPGKGKEYNDVHEMTLDLNITTYQNKIRVNVIEVSPNAKTIGYDLFDPEALSDLEEAKKRIIKRVRARISKEYKDYLFLF